MRLLITALLAFTCTVASAQYGQQYGNRRRSSISQMPQAKEEPPKPKTAEEIATERLPTYVSTFNLDPFESEVLRSNLVDHFNKMMALNKNQTLTPKEMREEFERYEKDFKSNLSTILSEDEIEQFIAMDFSSTGKRKRKKEKKEKNKEIDN